jgi:hypothetical protein
MLNETIDGFDPKDIDSWAHKLLRGFHGGDFAVGSDARDREHLQTYLSKYRAVEAVHPLCPMCAQPLRLPTSACLTTPLHTLRGKAFTIECAFCRTTATGVFYR